MRLPFGWVPYFFCGLLFHPAAQNMQAIRLNSTPYRQISLRPSETFPDRFSLPSRPSLPKHNNQIVGSFFRQTVYFNWKRLPVHQTCNKGNYLNNYFKMDFYRNLDLFVIITYPSSCFTSIPPLKKYRLSK